MAVRDATGRAGVGDALGRKLGWSRELGSAWYCARIGQQRGEVKGWVGRLSGLVGPRSRAGLGYEAFSSFLFFSVFLFLFPFLFYASHMCI